MSSITITSTQGVSVDSVLQYKFNLWVGVSDSNWFHASHNLERLVQFALDYTRKEVLIWVPGRLYASNYFHLDKMSRAQALRKGYAEETKFRLRVEAWLDAHTIERKRVRMVDYDHCLTSDFVYRRSILYRAFSQQGEFYQRMMEIAQDYLTARQRTASKHRVEASVVYLLEELPSFLAPLGMIDSDVVYQAGVYPGLGKLDILVNDLKEGKLFPDMTDMLRIEKPCGMVNVELED